jgi:hypothetical protein
MTYPFQTTTKWSEQYARVKVIEARAITTIGDAHVGQYSCALRLLF